MPVLCRRLYTIIDTTMSNLHARHSILILLCGRIPGKRRSYFQLIRFALPIQNQEIPVRNPNSDFYREVGGAFCPEMVCTPLNYRSKSLLAPPHIPHYFSKNRLVPSEKIVHIYFLYCVCCMYNYVYVA